MGDPQPSPKGFFFYQIKPMDAVHRLDGSGLLKYSVISKA